MSRRRRMPLWAMSVTAPLLLAVVGLRLMFWALLKIAIMANRAVRWLLDDACGDLESLTGLDRPERR